MDKNYEFKDLSTLSEAEKRNEILNYFDGVDVPYNKLNVAEYIYNYCKNRGSNIYYHIVKIIVKYFNEEDLSPENIKIMEKVYKWLRKLCYINKGGEDIYYKVFDFCRNNNLTDNFQIKDIVVGLKSLHLYCNCDGKVPDFDNVALNNLLNSVTTEDEIKALIQNAKSMEQIQSIFRYQLEDNYPDNQKGLTNTIFKCFRYVKEHQKMVNPDFDESDPTKISILSFNALYGMAYLYEKLLMHIKEKESLNYGEKRFADTYVLEFAKMFAQYPKVVLTREIVYNFDGLLDFLRSDILSDNEKFSDDELKQFLLDNLRAVFGLDIKYDDMVEKREIVNRVIDYANTDADEKVSIKNILATINPCMVYNHTETVDEQMKLLMGESLGNAYGEDKDPLSENEYRYYLRALEIKELFSDVAIQGITPEGLNNLIRENPEAFNNVRCTVIQMMLSKFIDYLFYVFDLEDGYDYYTNDKIALLQNIGIDINTLITIENLPYFCDFRSVYNMRKDDNSILWTNFSENVKLLKTHYMVDEIVDMIKYHPEVVFSDHNLLISYLKENSIESLYKWGRINPEYGD